MHLKLVSILFLGAVATGVIILLWRHQVEKDFFEQNYLKVGGSSYQSSKLVHPNASTNNRSEHQIGCNLPVDISPFDSSIQEYLVDLPKQVECSKGGQNNDFGSQTAPSPIKTSKDIDTLTYVDATDGRLKQSSTDYACRLNTITRQANSDSNFVLGDPIELNSSTGFKLLPGNNYLFIKCTSNVDPSKTYENIHYWFEPQAQVPNVDSNTPKSKPVSVLILVIESLSKVNYHRYMTSTKQVLEQRYGNMFYLNGLNKIADNSFPNMGPLLTGHRIYMNELPNEDHGPYDDWPFIWKQYSKRGYQTALVEDYPSFTLFNYESKGFVKSPPTDFYPRPYWMYLFDMFSWFILKVTPFNINPCYKDRTPKVDIFLDQIHHFVEQCNRHQQPFFAFTFYIELTHNDFNKAQTIDTHVATFLNESFGLLNDTIVIVMVRFLHFVVVGSNLTLFLGRPWESVWIVCTNDNRAHRGTNAIVRFTFAL